MVVYFLFFFIEFDFDFWFFLIFDHKEYFSVAAIFERGVVTTRFLRG